jgi:hypothetical protein
MNPTIEWQLQHVSCYTLSSVAANILHYNISQYTFVHVYAHHGTTILFSLDYRLLPVHIDHYLVAVPEKIVLEHICTQ